MARYGAVPLSGNHVKTKLTSGRLALGTIVGFVRNPAVIRMIAQAGYEFVIIDTEHSSFSIDLVSDMCEVARAAGLVPVVRPDLDNPSLARRLLDQGALGLMCPAVESRPQVETLRRPLREGPEARAAFDYRSLSGSEARRFFEDNLQLIIQIETRQGVERIDEILNGGGVDVVQIGRTDLSRSFEVLGERRHPLILDAVDRVAAACKKRGIPVGAMCDSEADGEDLVRRGVRWLIFSTDESLLFEGYERGSAMFRALSEGPRA